MEIITLLTVMFLCCAIFTFMSRVYGGGLVDFPLSLETWFISGYIGLLGLGFTWDKVGFFEDVTGIPRLTEISGFFVSFIFAFLGLRTGHGQYMDLASWKRKIEAEKMDIFVSPFFGRDINTVKDYVDGDWWRDFFGLFVTGVFVTLGLTLILITQGLFSLAFTAFVSGGLKCVAYYIGWDISPQNKDLKGFPDDLENAIDISEALRGSFLGLGLGILTYEVLTKLF